MRFSFSDDQRLFASAVRDLLAKECPPAKVREIWEGGTGHDPDLWAALADMGVVGLTVPEDAGGLGLNELDLVLLLEEAGRAACPAPLLETTAVAAPLLATAGDPDGWLPRIASGRAVVTAGLQGHPIAMAAAADLLLLQAERGDGLHAVPTGAVRLRPRPSLDPGRPLAVIDGPLPADAAAAGGDPTLWLRAFDRGALAAAAQLVGLAARMVELAAEYAKARQQFGKPIGSFQAVKHLLAGALVPVEFARPAVYRAAWSVATGQPSAGADVALAKARASDAATGAARAALQVHGAIGYTWEHDVHLWMKRAWGLAAAWGDAAFHRRRLAASLLR